MSERPWPEGGATRFFKCCAGGNDFLVLDALNEADADWGPDRARRCCARRLSLGADGVVVLARSERATARFVLRNADGSPAAFSGNGARCAVRVLHELGLAPDGRVTLETAGGVVAGEARRGADGSFRAAVEVAPPRDVAPKMELPAGAPSATGDFAVVGVPYLAVPVVDVDALDLATIAPPLRRWRVFPEGANVAFYEPPVASDAPVRLRTWERGVEGETLSSGTGCVIVAVSLWLRGHAPAEGESVRRFATRSGVDLAVTLEASQGAVRRVVLEGDARLVATGTLGPDALTGFA